MILYPTLLPRPTQRYGSSLDPRLAVTEFDRNFRQRQKYSGADEFIQVTWSFNQLEYDVFKTFVERILIQGSLEFTVDILGVDGLKSRVVKIQGGKYSMQLNNSRYYDISCILVAKPDALLDADIFEYIIGLTGSEVADLTSAGDVLFLYIENFFGNSSESSEVTDFLNS